MRILKSAAILAGIIFLLVGSFAAQATNHSENPFPFVLPWDDSAPGITDFRSINHQPAGSYGPVTAGPDGHFYTSNGRIRFLGVNLTGEWCFPPSETAEDRAIVAAAVARMAKFGVNLVRCHLFEAKFYPYGIFDKSKTTTRLLDPDAVRRLDYFVSLLKQNGIYVNMNLLAGRPFTKADGLPAEIDKIDPWNIKNFIAIFYAPMIELQKEFAQQLLTTARNQDRPTYAQDPAVAFLEINNERGLIDGWRRGYLSTLPAVFANDLSRQWNSWLATRYGTTMALQQSWGAGQAIGEEMLKNSNFSSGTTGWSIQISPPAVATQTLTAGALPPGVSGQSLGLDVTQVGTAGWHAQFFQAGLPVGTDQPYTVTFSAKADKSTTIDVGLIKATPNWDYLGFSKEVALDTTWKAFQFTFWTTKSESNARLQFTNMGTKLGSFYFAGISLRPGEIVGVKAGEQIENRSIPLFTTKADYLLRSKAAQADWIRFLRDTEDAYYQAINTHLKATLGAKAIVMGTQANYSALNVMAKLDAVDMHAYWQHPVNDATGWFFLNKSMVNERGGTVPDIGQYRAFNKAMSVSEYNHVSPNTYGSEGYLMLAAYAALQDWDAIYAYSYWGPHPDTFGNAWFVDPLKPVTEDYSAMYQFTINQNPQKMASLLAASAMFLRGDIASAKKQVVVSLNQNEEIALLRQGANIANASTLKVPRETALVHRVAVATEGQNVPGDALTPDQVALLADANTQIFTSDTGELTWDTTAKDRGVLTINSAKSKGVIGFGGGKSFDLSGVILEPGPGLQNGWSTLTLTATEGAFTSTTSNRLLVTATGYTQNTNMVWGNAEKSRVSNWGTSPTLVEGVPARITLPWPAGGVSAWALDERGLQKAALPILTANGNAQIEIGPDWKTLWYEVRYAAADISVVQSASSPSVLLNGNITYTLNVANAGPSTANAVTLTDTLPSGVNFVSASSTQGTCTGTNTVICNLGNLANGATASITITAKAIRVGTQTNTATLAAGGFDPSVNNNTAITSSTVVAADLTSNALAAIPSGTNLLISDRVLNQGTGAAASFEITYYLSDNTTYEGGTDLLLCKRIVSNLAAGAADPASGTIQTSCPVPSVPAGSYYVMALVDPGNSVSESNEANNVTSTAATISGVDVVPTSITASRSGSAKVLVSDAFKNQGNQPANSFKIRYYLSENTTYDSGDIALAKNSDGGICERSSSENTGNKTCHKPRGALDRKPYYVLVVVDATGQVVEYNEINNSKATAGTLQW